MPVCDVSTHQNEVDAANNNGIQIFYRTYGCGPVKVLLIIGLAGTHDSWGPQIKGLAGLMTPNDDVSLAGDRSNESGAAGGIEVCAFDNRGMGRSSVPAKKSEYTTKVMAKDAIAVMDHLGWEKAHVFGHSMGAMIACKLAALAPDRVSSLALLNVTGGGYECIPKLNCRTLAIAIRFLRAKTPEQRAAVDLDTHYTKEYVKNVSATGMQSTNGFEGQKNACWTHKMSIKEFESIRAAGFPVLVLHGRHDIIAQLSHAKRLMEKFCPSARMVELHGGHLVSHERTEEVNDALLELIKASESAISLYDWSNLPKKSTGCKATRITFGSAGYEQQGCFSFMVNIEKKLRILLLYFFGHFELVFEHLCRAMRILKPVKVEPALS